MDIVICITLLKKLGSNHHHDYVYDLNICTELIKVYNFEPIYKILISAMRRNKIDLIDICLGKGLIITDKMLEDLGCDIIHIGNFF